MTSHCHRLGLPPGKSKRKRISAAILGVLLYGSGPLCWGQQILPHPSERESERLAEEDRKSLRESLIEENIRIARWFDGVAEGLDLFLVGKKITEKRNESSIRVENTSISREGQPVTNTWGLSINPRFPNLEEYWQLKFTTYDEQEENRNVQRGYLRQSARQQNVGASVGVFNKFGDVRVAFQPRVELSNPLNISHSLSFETIGTYTNFQFNPRLEFYANPIKGVGIFQAYNVNFPLNPKMSVLWINQYDYIEKLNRLETTNGLALSQYLDSRTHLVHSFLIGANNRPGYHVETYTFSVAVSHIIYRRILDFALIPSLDFARERRFKGQAGLSLIFNLNF